mmetsp:Transcript_4898/g.11102  ORF Transcript_4898/g.11102 Transcript_4898/m.11102 type:complete len:229 (+) Transcript_4898:61-747(+)|eukprot:CAMPEP_0197888434 /NCGR_PEP_ID=MMETSP1439-20131203/21986_1 /TAXON_ID=66791 /ORGANISM="Gonyaulax spinifera, Strain CCMP409" /LENGTH=228 /DNA_ID=CAMNT_0043508345 /DNA_START=59 /DNA_END=745 /DNA_ORIENTATION=-
MGPRSGLPPVWAPLRAVLSACLVASLVPRAVCDKDNIVKLTKYNFHKNVQSGAWFVKFYAPWCTHCQRLAPIWEKLADQAVAREWPVKIAEVDCTVSADVCEKVAVKAYPMIALISDGKLKPYKNQEATLSNFESWLNSQEVLKTGSAASGGEKLDLDSGDSKSQSSTSPLTAASAVLSNLLGRLRTKSTIMDVYLYGGIGLLCLVGLLVTLFKLVDTGEPEEHEKEG